MLPYLRRLVSQVEYNMVGKKRLQIRPCTNWTTAKACATMMAEMPWKFTNVVAKQYNARRRR